MALARTTCGYGARQSWHRSLRRQYHLQQEPGCFKSWVGEQVSAAPHVQTIDLNESDEFLILACDGVWDVMTDDECVA